jgi:AcrR family transcriptional regulator
MEATRELLAEVGYARLTVEAIAQRAGVGKPTIYRWWRNRAEIVYEAVWAPPEDIPPDTGDLETDLRAYVDRLVRYFSREDVIAAFPGLVSDMFGGADGVSVVHDYSQRSLEHLRAILDAARARGELRDTVDVGAVTNVVVGSVLSWALGRTRRPGRRNRPIAERVVDLVLGGIRAP